MLFKFHTLLCENSGRPIWRGLQQLQEKHHQSMWYFSVYLLLFVIALSLLQ